jgi:hypothetical protein
LIKSWKDLKQNEQSESDEQKILSIEKSLRPLNLKHAADRWHLAEAIALKATWFLTNDRDIIEKTRPRPARVGNKMNNVMQNIGIIQGIRIARPSECLERISFHPVWGLIQQD